MDASSRLSCGRLTVHASVARKYDGNVTGASPVNRDGSLKSAFGRRTNEALKMRADLGLSWWCELLNGGELCKSGRCKVKKLMEGE